MEQGLRNYLVVTAGYWAFTVTDGAIRMLVVLYFHRIGYSPFEVAMLFLFYEFFGIVTNLVGGWLGARIGLNRTMHMGMAMQVAALLMLTVPLGWLSVPYVMVAQALSGIAKDLNKMSAKASVKTLAGEGQESKLFKWVAVLTGSKNALKGAGFFVGAALLQWLGFRGALFALAGALAAVMIATMLLLPAAVGKMKSSPRFSQVFSNTPAINWLSAARLFLFGARDVFGASIMAGAAAGHGAVGLGLPASGAGRLPVVVGRFRRGRLSAVPAPAGSGAARRAAGQGLNLMSGRNPWPYPGRVKSRYCRPPAPASRCSHSYRGCRQGRRGSR